MPRTRINCPNCRQPILADVEQLFDVGVDPSAKQRFLSGAVNIVQCPNCGYQGSLATPIVYHDPAKELLLSFIPPEIGLPRNEQERLIGGLINQVTSRLPKEQFKGYLFQPRAFLTLQSLVETILEADGITKEMIQAQQNRLKLMQRLLEIADADARAEVIQQEHELIDADFFNLLGRMGEAAMVSEDREAAQRLKDLQDDLLKHTEIGKQIKEQTDEINAAVKSLQDAGKELTREKLLELVIKAPTEARVRALVSLARQGMDYEFFRMLSDRVDRARDKGRKRLIDLRESLLELTRQYDQQVQARVGEARQHLTQLLQAENVTQATLENISQLDNFFLEALNAELDSARKGGDLEKISKLQEIMSVIQQASAPPAELELIEALLDAPDEQSRRALMEENREEITPEFLQMLAGLLSQVQQSNQDPELLARLQDLSRQARRFSMEMSLKG